MLSRRPSSQFSKSATSSRSSSRHPPPSSGSWDADSEDTMSTDEDHHSAQPPTQRPLTVSIPHATGPYCPRRPNLKEILAGTSPPPWTLTAFMAYLSANLCLENLEFTMDAGRYQKHYAKMMTKAGDDGKPPHKDSEYVRLLWIRLIDAYIAPNGSREVNLPSNVRDPILTAETTPMPPPPETLDLAVRKTYELMEDSVLVPFLNSCSETHLESASQSDRHSVGAFTHEEHSGMFSRMRRSRESPPPQSAHDNRMSAPMLGSKPRFSAKSSGGMLSTSNSNTSNTSDGMSANANWSGPGMTDDSGSTGSPTEGPMTPPMSPPMSDMHHGLSSSPKHGRDGNMWKKLGRLSGMKVGKKKSSGGFEEHS